MTGIDWVHILTCAGPMEVESLGQCQGLAITRSLDGSTRGYVITHVKTGYRLGGLWYSTIRRTWRAVRRLTDELDWNKNLDDLKADVRYREALQREWRTVATMTDLEKVRAVYQACKLLADATNAAWEWIYAKMPARVIGEVRGIYKRAGTPYGNNSTGEIRWMAEIGEGQ